MSDVVFRRIGGRVIPIRLNKSEKKDLAKGTALVGAGIALAAGGGMAYKKAIGTSIKYASRAATKIFSARSTRKMGQLSFDDLLQASKADKAREEAFGLMKKAQKFEKATPYIRKASWLVGTGLTSVGTAKIASALSKKENKREAKAVGLTAPGIAATSFMLGAYPKETFKMVLSKAAKLRF